MGGNHVENTVEYTAKEVIETFEKSFASEYKPFAKYQLEEHSLWQMLVLILQDTKLMNHIIFCNDMLELPPIRVIVAAKIDELEAMKLSAYDKKFMGAFCSFLFKSFGYTETRKTATGNPTIKTAMCFAKCPVQILFVPDMEEPTASEKAPKKGNKKENLKGGEGEAKGEENNRKNEK